MKPYIIGVDLGRMSDFTAIAIIEESFVRTNRPSLRDAVLDHEGPVMVERRWLLRHLERPAVGTPYDKIIGRVRKLLMTPELFDKAELVVDASGVGRPVIDMMTSLGLRPIPITITPGKAVSAERDEMGAVIGYHVPKADIVTSLLTWYEMRRFKVAPALALWPILEKELAAFVPKVTAALHVSYEALREGDHDDLVLATSMAMWYAAATRAWEVRHNLIEDREEAYNASDYLSP